MKKLTISLHRVLVVLGSWMGILVSLGITRLLELSYSVSEEDKVQFVVLTWGITSFILGGLFSIVSYLFWKYCIWIKLGNNGMEHGFGHYHYYEWVKISRFKRVGLWILVILGIWTGIFLGLGIAVLMLELNFIHRMLSFEAQEYFLLLTWALIGTILGMLFGVISFRIGNYFLCTRGAKERKEVGEK